VSDMQQPLHFRASKDFIRYATKELFGIATQHATNMEVVKPLPIPGSSQVGPSSIIIQGTKKGAKDDKKRLNWCPQWVATAADYYNDNDDDKNTDGFDMECVVAPTHSVKHQA
jgi:hypothetical protein